MLFREFSFVISVCYNECTHDPAVSGAGGVCCRRAHSMHYARIGRAATQIRPRRKMHDFGDLGRALEMVALLPEVALGG